MGGESYNSQYVEAQRLTVQGTIDAARTQGRYDLLVAQEQSKAVLAQARYDYQARIKEATLNYQTQMEALRVRDLESKREYKVAWKQAETDAVRAEGQNEASLLMAESKYKMAEARETREEARAKRYEEQSYTQSYWHGFS
jgi:uncharacterized membrane protein YqiK